MGPKEWSRPEPPVDPVTGQVGEHAGFTADRFRGANIPFYTGPPIDKEWERHREPVGVQVSGPDRDFTGVPVEPIG